MKVHERIKHYLEDNGIKQGWVVQRMNALEPGLKINPQKLSASLVGRRVIPSDELACLCEAIKADPRLFIDHADPATAATTPAAPATAAQAK